MNYFHYQEVKQSKGAAAPNPPIRVRNVRLSFTRVRANRSEAYANMSLADLLRDSIDMVRS